MSNNKGSLAPSVIEAVFYDDQFDHIIIVASNERLKGVRSTLQLSDEAASKGAHMLMQALTDMKTIRRLRTQHVS